MLTCVQVSLGCPTNTDLSSLIAVLTAVRVSSESLSAKGGADKNNSFFITEKD